MKITKYLSKDEIIQNALRAKNGDTVYATDTLMETFHFGEKQGNTGVKARQNLISVCYLHTGQMEMQGRWIKFLDKANCVIQNGTREEEILPMEPPQLKSYWKLQSIEDNYLFHPIY